MQPGLQRAPVPPKPRTVQNVINRLAHQRAQAYYLDTRRSLMQQLLAAQRDGEATRLLSEWQKLITFAANS